MKLELRCWRATALVWLGLASGLSVRAGLTNTATAYLTCASVSIRPATNAGPGLVASLALSGFANGLINNELSLDGALTNTGQYGAVAYIAAGTNAPILADLGVDLPGFGQPDPTISIGAFFNLSVGVTNGFTGGTFGYVDSKGVGHGGRVTAVWNRAPGATTGEVVFHLSASSLPGEVTTTNVFELFQYRGTIRYSPGLQIVNSWVDLARVAAPGRIQGPFTMRYVPLGGLSFAAGKWTNDAGGVLQFFGSDANAVTILPGASPQYYFTTLTFVDGLPGGRFIPQYEDWAVDITDPNDTNGNGIADLDDPTLVPAPVPPLLVASMDSGGFEVWVYGPPGQIVEADSAPNPSGPWTPIQHLTLDPGPTGLTLPAGGDPSAFYRVR